MQRLSTVLTLAVLTSVGCSQRPPAKATPGNESAIRSLTMKFASAFQAEDVDAILACMTDDFVALSEGKPPIEGKAAVKKAIENDLSTMEITTLRFIHDEIVVAGTWAFSRGRSIAEIVTDGETVQMEGKYLWILHQDFEGNWLIARDSGSGNGNESR